MALPPGERKSAVFNAVSSPLKQAERIERDRVRPELAQRAADREILESRLKQAKSRAARKAPPEEEQDAASQSNSPRVMTAIGPSDVKAIVREMEEMPEAVEPQYFCDDSTAEHVGHLLCRHRRMLQMGAEGTAFELALGRYADGRANFDVYLKGHSGDFLRVGRTTRDCSADSVDSPALSMALAVQPDVIAGLAREASARKRGFVARFLYALPKSRLGSRKVAAAPVPFDVTTAFENAMAVLWKPWTPNDGVKYLRLTPEADETLRDLERWLEPQLAEGEELSATAGWAAKLAGAVARIAGVLHGAAAVGEGREPDAVPVSAETTRAAVRLGKEYLLPHALAVLDLMGADDRFDTARHLWRCLHREIRKTNNPRFSRRDAHRWGGRRFRTVADVDPALMLLIEYGYVRQVTTAAQSTRRDSMQYEANPEAIGDGNTS
jgi:hypothetical protein